MRNLIRWAVLVYILGVLFGIKLAAADKYLPMPESFWGASNTACKVEPVTSPENKTLWHVHVYIKFPKGVWSALAAMRPYNQKNKAKQKDKARDDCMFWFKAQEKARDRFWKEYKEARNEKRL